MASIVKLGKSFEELKCEDIAAFLRKNSLENVADIFTGEV